MTRDMGQTLEAAVMDSKPSVTNQQKTTANRAAKPQGKLRRVPQVSLLRPGSVATNPGCSPIADPLIKREGELRPSNKCWISGRVSHISLVFREMWDTTALPPDSPPTPKTPFDALVIIKKASYDRSTAWTC